MRTAKALPLRCAFAFLPDRILTAVGDAASMAVKEGISPADVDIPRLRALLLSQNAILDTEGLAAQ